MSVLENYLHTLFSLRGATVAETSYYGELQKLLNEVGSGLRPRVQAVVHVKNTGAGIPDLVLLDENQSPDQNPAHGTVEAKGVSADLMAIARGEQVTRYLTHYGQVLVTNYYQFVLVTRDRHTGQAVIEERYDLAANEAAFWSAAAHPRTLAGAHETALREYLLRVMRRNAPLTNPQDVAWILASYAREAKARMKVGGADLAALQRIRQQMESALGVRFEGETAEDFFRSTLVQTLFYGLFSAWVLWHEKHPAAESAFDLWRDTRRMNIPVISELFNQFSDGAVLPLSVEQILDWTVDALNRVERTAFFASFNTGATVQYFYEPFLEAFDPDLRRQLGVWYTPPEVVEYMVARVDAALKTELGIADGLADSSVFILDPCCGTGAYLVAVLRHIYAAQAKQAGAILAAQAVQQAMRERVFGFEILPAPFVVAHLQIGMLLNNLHAPLSAGQRAGVYLTNALTGWDTGSAPKTALLFPELEREREAADTVKRHRPILVILGNPPYSGFAGVAVEEERELSEAYRTTHNPALPRPQGQGLNDLYVRFFRMAERRIAEGTGRGVVSFISNYSWLDGLSHPGMRERYLDAFDIVTIDNLNGDKYKTGKTTPEGKPDPSIFSTEFNREGIQVGTAIATMVRKPQHEGIKSVRFRHLWGTGKRAQLKSEVVDVNAAVYQEVIPALELGLPFLPHAFGADYFTWPLLPELFPASFPGVKTSRDDVVVDIDKERLVEAVQAYLQANSGAAYEANKITRYAYRPFDIRWLYWDEAILDRARPDYFPHVQPGNAWLEARQRQSMEHFDRGLFTHVLADNLGNGLSSYFPLYLYAAPKNQLALFDADPVAVGGRKPNLSDRAKDYLAGVLVPTPSPSPLHGEGSPESVLIPPRYEVERGLGGEEKDAAKPYAVVYGSTELWEKIKPLARQMRHEPTATESMLWDVLRGRKFEGYKFRRQHPIDRFIVDFYCPQGHLVIEVDGEIHNYTVEEDALRQMFIESRGLRVLRFTNRQIIHDLPAVMEAIHTALVENIPTPIPSPLHGEGSPESALIPPRYEVERGLGGEDVNAGAELLFYHTLAVLHAPAYRTQNAGALRQDWPRVPLPKTRAALEASAGMGRQLAALLDVETPVPGVTQGDPQENLRTIAVLTTVSDGAPNFTINVNWGFFGAGSAVMPGRGKLTESDGCVDVYLNDSTYWSGIPQTVWEYTLGGYQVLKKWLSYRETRVLGRPLKPEEAREFMCNARRIAALLALNPALDANYRAVTG